MKSIIQSHQPQNFRYPFLGSLWKASARRIVHGGVTSALLVSRFIEIVAS